MPESSEYDVGYKKPPKGHQFKPGQSGNPKGRPKKIKSIKGLFEQELDRTVWIREGERRVRISLGEAIAKRAVTDAAKGDFRSMKLVLSYLDKDLAVEDFEPDAADREALRQLFTEFKDAGQLNCAKDGDDGRSGN